MNTNWRPGMACGGRHTLVQRLGSGAFGEVWLAEDASKQRVALKISPPRRGQKIYTQFFKQEFSLLSELRHAHLARVFDFGVAAGGDYYFTEEYCSGRNFIEAVQDRPISFFEIGLVQLLSALDYIHTMGIVHFDIKADNILVAEKDGKPNVKVLDFGIASRLKDVRGFGMGTPIYMAPELVQRSQHLDHRVDLYSLGMLCLRALTGELPFPKDKTSAILQWHVEGRIPESIWEARPVPKHLRELIEKLLQKRPDDRFSSARVAINFLNQTTGHRYRKEEEALQPQLPPEGPLVGRDALLETIKKRIEGSQISILSGDTGIGKSRILLEVRRWLEWKEIRFFQMTSEPQAPFWTRFADEPDEILRARRRATLLLEESRRLPYGFLMDDAHAADHETRLFLTELLANLKQPKGKPLPFFVVLATEEGDETSLPLGRLGAGDVAHYCEQVLGKRDGIERVSQLLFSYSGGLPLLMVEGLRFLAPRFLRGERLEDLVLPAGLGSLYDRKIEDLTEDEKEILFVLALLSRPARIDELAAILDRSLEDLSKLLAGSQRSGLVSSTYEDPAHQLSSQALAFDLIRRLSAEQKTALHRKIASGLESKVIPPEELGSHWAQGDEKEKGKRYFQLASSRFKEVGHLSRATKFLLEATALSAKGSEEWAGLKEETTRLLISMGDFAGAESSLRELEEANPSVPGLSEIKGLLAFKKRDFRTAKEHYEAALRHSPDDVISRIGIENALANIDLQSGLWEEARRLFEKTLEAEESLPPELRKKISGNNLGLALCRLGRFEEAVRYYEKCFHARGSDSKEEIAIRNALGYVFIQSSRFAEAIACLEQARLLTADHGGLHILFSILGNLITAYFKEARYVESLDVLKELISWQERFGSERDIAYNLLRQGSTYLVLGMEEAAQDGFERGLSLVQNSDPVLACWFRLMEAYREREFGDPEKAKALLDRLLEAKNLPDQSHMAWASLTLADMAYREGKIEEARNHLKEVPQPFTDEEVEIRRDLLIAKMFEKASEESSAALFTSLEERCLRNHFQELLWETYHAWGLSLLKAGDRKGAIDRMEKGVAVIRRIGASLPEEYRDRYLRFKERVALFHDLEAIRNS